MRAKHEILDDLRDMVRDLFSARESGEAYARLARAHGYVDGFMRGLLETDVASKEEILEIVSQERERASGPAIRTLDEGDAVRAA
jgi:hypothetical protein